MQIQGILNLGLTILLLRFFRIKLEKLLSYFKSVPWNFGICNARFNMKELKFWDQISLFSYFLDTIWKTIVIFGWNLHPRICPHAKFHLKRKKLGAPIPNLFLKGNIFVQIKLNLWLRNCRKTLWKDPN